MTTWRPRRRDLIAAARRRWERRDRRSFIIFLLAVPIIVGVIWWRIGIAQRRAGPWIDESGIVTVVGLVDARVGRFRASYYHDVILPNGSASVMRFDNAFPKDSRLWASYRRWLRTNAVEVKAYVPQ